MDTADPGGGDSVPVAPGVRIPLGAITWRFSTAGGPGGQHVNTSNTRAEATFDVAGCEALPGWARDRLLERLGPTVAVAAGDTRSQARNRELAIERLVERLTRALERQPVRRPTRPTAASRRRRLEAKRRRSQIKGDRRRGRGAGGED